MTGPHFLRIRPGEQPTGVPVRQPYRHDSRPAERTAAGRSARKREKKNRHAACTRSVRNRRDRRTSGAGVRPPRSAGTKKPAVMDIRGRFFGSQDRKTPPAFPTESPSLQQRQQLPERSDPVRRTAFARHTRGIEPDRIDPAFTPAKSRAYSKMRGSGLFAPASSEQTTPRK